jgi:hypothetical protein
MLIAIQIAFLMTIMNNGVATARHHLGELDNFLGKSASDILFI